MSRKHDLQALRWEPEENESNPEWGIARDRRRIQTAAGCVRLRAKLNETTIDRGDAGGRPSLSMAGNLTKRLILFGL